MTLPADKRKAHANPTKAFFVRMITRDISLEDCIFDLIDNSVDGAWRLTGSQPLTLADTTDLSMYRIDIHMSAERFEIKDNCGGISLDDAVDYAFTFGRKDDADPDDFSIGVYGIGMKRAIFKIGSKIVVKSSYQEEERAELSAFKVPIKVDDWLESGAEDWDFSIEDMEPMPQPGVEILIDVLNEASSRSFDSPRFVQNLRRAIGRDYALHLHRGLKIVVNGEQVEGWRIVLREGGDFSPMREKIEHQVDGEIVNVEIIAGMEAPPPDNNDPSEAESAQSRSGWYVVCNGRIVVAADRTTLTGWGTEGWPQWHPQYNGFLGLIFFSSRRADLLPLTTTKRSVDEGSSVFRQFRPRMRDVSKAWIAYTNARKQTQEEAREKEEAARPVAISQVRERTTVELPKLVATPKEQMANISYSVLRSKYKALAEGFGSPRMTQRDVGLESFDYAYRDLVGEE